jgi:carboxypeptidase T
VDLNRNSGFRWNACESNWCSSSDPCSTTYRGQSAVSEPETRTLQAFAKSIFPVQRPQTLQASAPLTTTGLLLSLHSYGEVILFPWGWSDAPSPNDAGLRELGTRLGQPLSYRACQTGEPGCLYQADGTLEDWAYGRLGIPAYTLEFGTDFFQQCAYFENEILNPAFESLLLGFKYARMPYATSRGPQVHQIDLTGEQIVQGRPLTLTVTFDSTPAVVAEELGFRYSVDNPSWVAEPSSIREVLATAPRTQSRVMVSHAIDTDSLKLGRHVLFVEGIDGVGNTGVPTATYVDIVGDYTYFFPFFSAESWPQH